MYFHFYQVFSTYVHGLAISCYTF